MSDAGGATEPKQRVTRSSIGQAGSGTSAPPADASRLEDAGAADRPQSPSSNPSPPRNAEGTPMAEMKVAVSAEQSTPGNTSISAPMKRKMGVTPAPASQATRRSLRSSNKLNTDEESDRYCWRCRKDGVVISCQLCPRVYHTKCLDMTATPLDDWICIECEKVMRSECEDTKPRALVNLSMDHLITCLQFALERMKVPNSEVFQIPVDPAMEPEYHNIIAHPMDMSQLDKNIKKKMYCSTQAFLADAMWILHNSIVYNGMHNKYTMTAKAILKVCRSQMTEIETCPDCFLSSCTQEHNWFCKPCRYSHPLVWAKLKGYPFWPAKALRENDGQVDCRFFGAHDKAWLPANQVYMLSNEPPAPVKNKKGSGFDEAMAELDKYITKFKARYGTFTYAPVKEPYKVDFGQTLTVESKKRKIESPSSVDGSATKRSVGPGEVVAKPEPVSTPPELKEVKPPVKIEPSNPGSLPVGPMSYEEMKDVLDSRPCVNKVASWLAKIEPVPIGGVFTISDEMLADASSFSLVKDEEMALLPSSSLVNKIEETLKSAKRAEQSSASGKTDVEDFSSGEKMDVDSSIATISNSQTSTNNPAESKPVSNKLTNQKSSPMKEPVASSSQHVEPTQSDTPAAASSNSSTSVLAKTTEPVKPTGSSEQCNTASSSAEQEVAKSPKGMECSTEPHTSQSAAAFPAADKEYTEKLERTIESCKSSLGVDKPEENVSEESESESESQSDDEESSGSRYARGQRRVRERRDIREVMTEKELAVTNQLLQLMRDGLQPTIRDVVRQALLGETSVPDKQSDSKSDERVQTSQSKVSANTEQEAAAKAPAASSGSADCIPKSEPLAESTNQENSQDADPSLNKELAEKLTWKHKCEIEAVKHNAELAALEMRKSIELEKERALWRLRKQLEHKFKKIIEETKKKQWCAMCGKEAIFYCCWNTSYCDYPCQQKHWPNHLKTCAQISKEDGGEKKQQPQPQRAQSPSTSVERTPQSTHSSTAPPPYMPATTASGDAPPAPQYQHISSQQVQYMPAPSAPANASHVYQAQLPVQAMPLSSGSRNQGSTTGAPLLYSVMPQGQTQPPQPQSYMMNQRQPYRLAPKYS